MNTRFLNIGPRMLFFNKGRVNKVVKHSILRAEIRYAVGNVKECSYSS